MAPPSSIHIQALGKKIEVPTGIFINNEFVEGHGEPIESINPATEESLGKVQSASREDVDLAVAAARKAFETTWGINMPGLERATLMNKLAALLEENVEELGILESLDTGKPVLAAKGDITESAACLRYYAGWADKIYGQTIEANDSVKMVFTKHEPIGVCGQIVPWNYPILMWAWKVGPALATGCSIVFKPAELTPLSTLKLAELFIKAGFPPGVFNVVNGYGAVTGAAISEHMGIDKVAFTGSTLVGRTIATAAAKTNLKKVTLELGGKSGSIVFPSADLEQAVAWSCFGIFENMGQSCCAGSRIIVHNSILDKFIELYAAAAKKHKVGDPLQEDTFQGPQVSKGQFDKILGYIETGKKEGALVKSGGQRFGSRGYFVEPTIFVTKNDTTIAREEIFGPVVCVIPFETEEEAITIANDTSYGLAAGLHSKDADQILRVAKKLKAGTVWINEYNVTHNQSPFGGYKGSGWGRELGSYGINEYTIVKNYIWNHGERLAWGKGGPIFS